MKKRYALAVLALMVIVCAGCETVKGIGKDITAVGGWMTRGAEKAQNPDM